MKDVINPVYFKEQERLIKKAITRGRVVIAADPTDKSHAFGWICLDHMGAVDVIHYLYVKEIYRCFGVGRTLMTQIKTDPFVFTHRTEVSKSLERGGIYNPYVFLGG